MLLDLQLSEAAVNILSCYAGFVTKCRSTSLLMFQGTFFLSFSFTNILVILGLNGINIQKNV